MDARGYELDALLSANSANDGTILVDGAVNFPFADQSFEAVVAFDGLEYLADKLISEIILEIRRVTRRSLILNITTKPALDETPKGRRGWETFCFERGFRKHPLYYRLNNYASLESDGARLLIPLEKVPTEAWSLYPMASLREERDLHMDMLRESGSRSDAHVGRYHFAACFIRPGDAVLDAACGLGYGTYVVQTTTKARCVVGIDASDYGVAYARLNFGSEGASFRCGMLPECLADIPDNSIDHILSFETLEHVEDPIRLLEEFHRVLSPGGRLTCSVPHDWSDESGTDPNPFHFHVYDRARFVGELSRYFDLEHLVAQTADRVKKPGNECIWLKRPRSINEIPIDQEGIEAEWLVAVVSKSPLEGVRVPYEEQVYSAYEQNEAGNALAFRRDYENPWLIRSLVSIGLRTTNAELREKWSRHVVHASHPLSADRGAALCVLAYAVLSGDIVGEQGELLAEIDRYVCEGVGNKNPTVVRWRISLLNVLGLLAMSKGEHAEASRLFGEVGAFPAQQYSHTLLTKPVEASYLQGLLLLADGSAQEAKAVWWDAFRRISSALGERLIQGYATQPPSFEIRELSTVLTLCARLVVAASNANLSLNRPGVFFDECHADAMAQLKLMDDRLNTLAQGKNWLEGKWSEQNLALSEQQGVIGELQIHIDKLEEVLKSRNTS
jgi:ubiquinone/menaquinone biosynthesis C-methylase UbiE